MKRLLMPATTLTTLKRIAFTLFCCTVLMVFAAPAQTLQQIKTDPGHNNPPPPGAILDLANPPQAIPGGGNNTYHQYTANFTATSTTTAITFAFREDPAFISFSNASVTDVTTPSGELLTNGDFSLGTVGSTPANWTYANTYGVSFGGVVQSSCGVGSDGQYGVGNCWFDGAVQAYDAISQTIATNPGDNYLISFWVADNSGCRTEPVGTPCNFSDLSTNGDVSDPGGNGINVTVYAQGGLPPQQGQPFDPNNPATFSQSFVQNGVTGQQVAADFNFLTAFDAGTLTFTSGTVPYVGFSGMTQAQYHALVAGSALADTSCLTALGFTDSSGHSLCVGTGFTATIPGVQVPSGAYLPQSTSRNIVLTQTLDLDPNQGGPVIAGPPALLVIPPGYAPVVAEFNDSGACPFASGDPLYGVECPRSIGTSYQDGPTKPGGTPKPAGSTSSFGCCEPEWTTQPTSALWTNQTASIPVSFYSTPPVTPIPNTNGFHAAQGKGVSFGAVAQGVMLDPKIDFPTEQTALNSTQPSGCPISTNWMDQVVEPYAASGTLTQYDNGGLPAGFAEGAYQLLYAPLDCDEFLGLKYPASINLAGDGTGPNVAQWFSVPFNVDKTNPTISPITLNPPGGYYAQNAPGVTGSMICHDPLGNGGAAASGIGSCGGTSAPPTNGTGPSSFTVSAGVNTSAIGSYMFTFPAGATDVAGNSSGPPTPVPYQVVGNADLGIGMLGNFLVKAGQTITYYILVANAGPSTAYEGVVNDTLPANTSFVSAGYSICVTLKCLLSPPTNSCQSTSGSCTIGTLPAWTPKNPVVAEVQITVKVNTNVQPKTTIKNTATVGGVAGADPNSKNNTATWSTLVTK